MVKPRVVHKNRDGDLAVVFDTWQGYEDFVADIMAQAWIEGRNAGLEDARLSDEDDIPAVTANPYIPTDEWTFGL